MSNTEMLGARIPKELKKLVDADSRTNQEIVEAALWQEFGGRKKSSLEAKKKHKLQQAQAAKASMETEREEYERLMEQVEAINSQIETMESTVDQYEDNLEELLNLLELGEISYLDSEHPKVREIAEENVEDHKTVHQDLKELAAKQGRNLQNTDFMRKTRADHLANNGKAIPIAEAVDLEDGQGDSDEDGDDEDDDPTIMTDGGVDLEPSGAQAGNSELVDIFSDFFRKYYDKEIKELAQHYPNEQSSLTVDLKDVYRFDPDLEDDIRNQPEQLQRYAEEALRLYDLPIDVNLERASVKWENATEPRPVGSLRSDDSNTLVTVYGQVSRVAEVVSKIREAAFECQLCGTLNRVPQSGVDLQEPHECHGCEREGPFQVNFDQSVFVDHKTARLELPPELADGSSGTLEVRFEGRDLVNQELRPGDRIEITGAVRLEQRTNDSPLFEQYLEGMSITHTEGDDDVDLSEYRDEIEEIADRDTLMEDLIGSFAPSIYGHNKAKQAILLQLVGAPTYSRPGDGGERRGESHILLVGDPGTGKSELLRAADRLAPRSVWADGTGATAAGLTAGLERDELDPGQDFAISAGAMVRASGGMVCLDEMDKATEGAINALHGPLEDRQVSLSKVADATLPARTSLLAAANPKHGSFDTREPIVQQIDIPEPIFTRFDLIFSVQGTTDTDRNRKIATHMMSTESVASRAANDMPLSEDELEKTKPAIPEDVLQAYIASAREIDPVMPEERQEQIVDFYAGVVSDADETMPITPRKLEAINRLSYAAARIRHSETVSSNDVDLAIRLVKHVMERFESDPESGELDAYQTERGMSGSQYDRVRTIESILQDKGAVPKTQLIEIASSGSHSESDVSRTVENMIQRGKLYRTDDGYRLSSD